jgi:vitamin B12 transporter
MPFTMRSLERSALRCKDAYPSSVATLLAGSIFGAIPLSNASAQISVSPPIELPAVKVTAPPPTASPPAPSVAGSSSARNGPSVVVSPTSVATPGELVASSVTVITAQDLENQQRRTVPDALMTVPGINVVQSGGPGGLTSVFMRGTNSNHVKVLIDGIDVSDPSNANRSFDFGQLLTSDLAQIEILRGPQSGLYGADALGGVIVITTKKGEGPPKITGSAEGGSFGTFNQTASASGSEGPVNYSLNISHLHSTDTPVTPLDLLPPGRLRNNDYYDNLTYATKFGWDVSPYLAFNVVARYTDATLKFTGDDFSTFPPAPSANQSIQTVHQLYTRGETVLTLLDGRFKNYFAVGYTNDWNWNFSPDTLPAVTVNQGDRIKYDWRGVATLAPGITLIMGLEDQTERLQVPTTTAEESNRAGYLELQTEIAKRFYLAANVRLDDNENFGEHTTWRVAPAFILPGTDTKLKVSVGTAFKAPSLSQRFVDFPAFGFFANRNLQPEESLGYDVGFEQPLFKNRFRFGTTYFHNDITNLISFNDTFTTNINIGRAETYGTESFASLAVTQWFKLRADYTHTTAIDATTGLELLRRPKDKASLTGVWKPIDPWTLSATVLTVSSWVDTDRFGLTPRLTAPGYTVVNVAADYKVNERATVFGRVDNLFNEHYEDPTGFLRPGIGVFAGVKFSN